MTRAYTATAAPQEAPAPYPGDGEVSGPEVLFVCARGAGRSPMGAALLEQHSHGRIQARSAGTSPAPAVAPTVVAAMAELGVDLSGHRPTQLTDGAVRAASVVITMGCGDIVPVYPHTRYLAWEVDDPAGRSLEDVRAIRDEIDTRVRVLLYSLGVAARVGLLRGGSAAAHPGGDHRNGPETISAPVISTPAAAGQTPPGQVAGGPPRLPVPPPRTRAYLTRGGPRFGPALRG
ncbi:arsenate reductase (thioredoxin) [Frankia sp. AiPs1]|uniref:arsenate-mycothiol transferase ArsC n=1 Tax=Frankia sp. AiPa1 TaxID=573492 RepID=UPI0027E5676D|nr:hypothetical protein [Frankia sp. AiPa1]